MAKTCPKCNTQVNEIDKFCHQCGQDLTKVENMKCFYHPDRDAVSECSACRHNVCKECQYVTGSHPICRNCWGHEVSAHKINTKEFKGVVWQKTEATR